MRWLMLIGVALCACERPAPVSAPPPPPPAPRLPIEWATTSKLGHATVISRRADKSCHVSCEDSATVVWERTECLAQADDHRFVTDDCTTFVAIHDAPFVDPIVARTRVGRIWHAKGEPVSLRLGQLAKPGGWKLSDSQRWVAWLRGTVEYTGQAPRYLPKGDGVEFETLDGVNHVLTFAQLSRWFDPPDPAPTAAPSQPAPPVYQWVDGDGVTNVTSWAQVPAAARSKAVPIEIERSTPSSSARDVLSIAPLRQLRDGDGQAVLVFQVTQKVTRLRVTVVAESPTGGRIAKEEAELVAPFQFLVPFSRPLTRDTVFQISAKVDGGGTRSVRWSTADRGPSVPGGLHLARICGVISVWGMVEGWGVTRARARILGTDRSNSLMNQKGGGVYTPEANAFFAVKEMRPRVVLWGDTGPTHLIWPLSSVRENGVIVADVTIEDQYGRQISASMVRTIDEVVEGPKLLPCD